MKRGRKKKPTSVKVLEGNPGKRRLNKEEPTYRPAITTPPDWLDPIAKEHWLRLAPELVAQGVLTVVDLPAFETYCTAYATWKKAVLELQKFQHPLFKTPKGYIQQHPYVSIARQAETSLRSLGSDFGLTPAARANLEKGEPGDQPPIGAAAGKTQAARRASSILGEA